MARSTAVKKAAGTAVANLADRLKAMAAESSERTGAAGGGLTIRLKKDKTFELPDGSRSPAGKPLRVVIVDHATNRAWFDRPYKEGEVSPPACAASNLSGKDMVPFAKAPNKQSKDCENCPYNQWGSAANGGDGKACRESRKLAVLAADKPDGPIMVLQVPPTSLKNYDAYVKMLAKTFQRPPVAYVTEIAFDTTVEHQKLTFGSPVNLDSDVLADFLERVDEAKELLTAEPDFSSYEAPSKAKPKGRGGRV